MFANQNVRAKLRPSFLEPVPVARTHRPRCSVAGGPDPKRAMASYVFARVNDERHRTREQALEDLVGLVRDEHYYTRRATPPKIMRRTPMIGIGCHGGRGLFVLGHCAGFAWERLSDDYLPYEHRIDVMWDGAVYAADYDAVLDGVEKFNERSWTSATRRDYALVHARILDSDVVARVRDRGSPP